MCHYSIDQEPLALLSQPDTYTDIDTVANARQQKHGRNSTKQHQQQHDSNNCMPDTYYALSKVHEK